MQWLADSQVQWEARCQPRKTSRVAPGDGSWSIDLRDMKVSLYPIPQPSLWGAAGLGSEHWKVEGHCGRFVSWNDIRGGNKTKFSCHCKDVPQPCRQEVVSLQSKVIACVVFCNDVYDGLSPSKIQSWSVDVDLVSFKIFQTSFESILFYSMPLDLSYSGTSQGLQRMRRTTQFQSTCPCRPLSFLRCRKKWGKWSILKQSETRIITYGCWTKNRGIPKWMVYNGKPYKNGWFGGTTIFGNTHILPKHFWFQSSMFCRFEFWPFFFRPGIQEIAPNKVCVWMTMTTLEAASQCLKNAVLFHGLPGQVRIIDLKGTNWRLWRPVMVSPHWWLL